ncbi:MAG: ABC transporter substrate-binding protein [Pseudomonadota bacterium]
MTVKIEKSGLLGSDGDLSFGDLSVNDQFLVKRALGKGANRREVMGWLMASGATIAAAGSIVSGASEALAMTPKKGGRVRVATNQHGPADTLDPILFTQSIDYGRGRMIYNNLVRFNEDLTVGPELALEWESNPDATEWTFKLRTDVEWHDGSKFTADDVVFSLQRHVGKDSKSKAKVLVASVDEWVKIDSHTVKAKLNSADAELPIVLGTFHFRIVKAGTTDFSKGIGTGPYRLTEFTPGVRSIHDRNDNYWNSDHEGPYIDQYEFFAITDDVARVNALLSGDVHAINSLDPKSYEQVKGTNGVEMLPMPSGRYPTISCMLDREPGNNPDFVMGLKHLQRRDRILKVIQKNVGSLGNDQPIGPAYGAGWCKEVNDPPRAYDPDKAKFHLKKSGLSGAELHVAEVGPGITDMCLLMQRECAKVGFTLNLKKVPNDGYWGAVWMKQPLNVSNWNMRPSANIMMTLAYKSDAPWNETQWKSERFDQLLAMGRAELDPKKRYEINCEAQKLCSDGSGSLIATHSAYVDGISSKLKGFRRVPIESFGGMEFPEYLWLDA